MKVIVLVGLPGAGKSTWAKEQSGTILSSDAMRLVLSGDENNQSIHGQVFGAMRYLLKCRLEIGATPTIIDSTNLRRKDRKVWIRIARKFSAAVEAVYFDIPVELALERNKGRDRVVPEDVIRAMAANLSLPSVEEGFSVVRTIHV